QAQTRTLEQRMQNLIAPRAAVALGRRRSFISSQHPDRAQSARLVEFQRLLARAAKIKVGRHLHTRLLMRFDADAALLRDDASRPPRDEVCGITARRGRSASPSPAYAR